MKKKILSSILLLNFYYSHAQDNNIKIEINSIEQKSRQAIVEKDTATLRKLWSPAFMVNAPTNRVIIGGQVEIVTGGMVSYTSYKGEMEELLVNGDIVITMGHESVVPSTGSPVKYATHKVLLHYLMNAVCSNETVAKTIQRGLYRVVFTNPSQQ